MLEPSTLAKIHIAKKQLALDDETYRTMLQSVGGVASSRDLTSEGAAKVLRHLERCGFKPKANTGKRPSVTNARNPRMGKIEALLAASGRPWSYADAIAKRVCKVESLRFCDGDMLSKVIAALQIDAKRRGA